MVRKIQSSSSFAAVVLEYSAERASEPRAEPLPERAEPLRLPEELQQPVLAKRLLQERCRRVRSSGAGSTPCL